MFPDFDVIIVDKKQDDKVVLTIPGWPFLFFLALLSMFGSMLHMNC